jgi:hypothetical protein
MKQLKLHHGTNRSFATTAFLQHEQVGQLDEMAHAFFQRHHKRLARAKMIRSFIEAAMILEDRGAINLNQPDREALTAEMRSGLANHQVRRAGIGD